MRLSGTDPVPRGTKSGLPESSRWLPTSSPSPDVLVLWHGHLWRPAGGLGLGKRGRVLIAFVPC